VENDNIIMMRGLEGGLACTMKEMTAAKGRPGSAWKPDFEIFHSPLAMVGARSR